MICLNVAVDATLCQALRTGGWSRLRHAWDHFCRRHAVGDLGSVDDLFECDSNPTSDDLSHLDDALLSVERQIQESVEHVSRWLPDVAEDITHPLTVGLLPCGKYCFGPQTGLQLFPLYADASPTEAYLFLVHVYYHELSFLNETTRARQCSVEQRTADDFREYIRLSIRNEGIGNYAILDDLIDFREAHPDYAFRYFTYARKIGNTELLERAVSILSNAMASVNDENVASFAGGINRIFKNEALPIINLVGAHMAASIVARHDAAALKNVYQRNARDFFALYAETAAPFAEQLRDL